MSFVEQIVLISIGGLIGLVSSLAGAWFSFYLDKKKKAAEIEREDMLRKAEIEREERLRIRDSLTKGVDQINIPSPADWMRGFSIGGETPQDFRQKCLCVFVLDTSSSMGGHAIQQLNRGLQEFYYAIKNDKRMVDSLEVSIITFNSCVDTVLDPTLIENFDMPFLEVGGTSKLAYGVHEAISTVETRKKWYKDTGQPYSRPWIILVSKGVPDSDQDVERLSNEINSHVENNDFFFLTVGVKGADLNTLNQISSTRNAPVIIEESKLAIFFKWLSTAMTAAIVGEAWFKLD